MSIGMFLLAVYTLGVVWVFVQSLAMARASSSWEGPLSIAASLAGALTWPLLVLAVLVESIKGKPGDKNG